MQRAAFNPGALFLLQLNSKVMILGTWLLPGLQGPQWPPSTVLKRLSSFLNCQPNFHLHWIHWITLQSLVTCYSVSKGGFHCRTTLQKLLAACSKGSLNYTDKQQQVEAQHLQSWASQAAVDHSAPSMGDSPAEQLVGSPVQEASSRPNSGAPWLKISVLVCLFLSKPASGGCKSETTTLAKYLYLYIYSFTQGAQAPSSSKFWWCSQNLN